MTSRQFAAKSSPDFFSNSSYFSLSRAKICISRIPDRCSDKKAFISVIFVRVIWYARLERKRKTNVRTATTGSRAKEKAAMRGSIAYITAAYPRIFTMFLKSFTRMVEKSSFMASVSFETRVTSVPTGVALKNDMERLWMCSKASSRIL